MRKQQKKHPLFSQPIQKGRDDLSQRVLLCFFTPILEKTKEKELRLPLSQIQPLQNMQDTCIFSGCLAFLRRKEPEGLQRRMP